MGSSDEASQKQISETVSMMRKKSGLGEPAVVSPRTGRVTVVERKPSVDLIDKRKER
jgi:hypothetical protein